MLVDAHPLGEVVGVQLGVELRHVHVGTHPVHLDGAGLAGGQQFNTGRDTVAALLVTDERLESVGKALEQRIGAARRRDGDRRRPDRLTVGPVHQPAEMGGHGTDAVAQAQERLITGHDLPEEQAQVVLDAQLQGRLVGVRNIERTAAEEDACEGVEVEVEVGQRGGFQPHMHQVVGVKAGVPGHRRVLRQGRAVVVAGADQQEGFHERRLLGASAPVSSASSLTTVRRSPDRSNSRRIRA